VAATNTVEDARARIAQAVERANTQGTDATQAAWYDGFTACAEAHAAMTLPWEWREFASWHLRWGGKYLRLRQKYIEEASALRWAYRVSVLDHTGQWPEHNTTVWPVPEGFASAAEAVRHAEEMLAREGAPVAELVSHG
jgi:hypothetical protein